MTLSFAMVIFNDKDIATMLLTINKELADSDTSHNVQAEAACACSVLFLLVIP
jgi:hypothetical protein